MEKQLTAVNLKNVLWETLNNVKNGKIQYADADAIAGQSREILRTVKTQLQIAAATNRSVPMEVVNFSEAVEPKAKKK